MAYTVIAIYVAMAVCVATWVLHVGILFGSCKPIALNWDPTTAGNYYLKGVTEYVIAMSSNLAMDIVVVLIPAPEAQACVDSKENRYQLHIWTWNSVSKLVQRQ
jgi:hypothetical protein